MAPDATTAEDDDRLRRDLYEQITDQVDLETSTIRLADQELPWLRVANPDVLLDLAVAHEQTSESQGAAEIDPFWAATWRAAIGLDRFLERLDLHNAPLLEVGCGSGQAGMAAALRGAAVTSTDSVELALQVARLNCWTARDRIQHRKLVWSVDRLDVAPFPIIIGSDLVYDPSLFPALEACLRTHLAQSGHVYLSEPHRHSGDRFARWIIDAGWQSQEHDLDLGDGRVPIRIFDCCV